MITDAGYPQYTQVVMITDAGYPQYTQVVMMPDIHSILG